MRKLLIHLKGYRREAILAPLLKLFEAVLELAVPLVMAAIIDYGIRQADKPAIARWGFFLFLLAGFGFAFAVTAQYFAAKAAVGFATNLRQSLFDRIQTFGYTQLDRCGTSTLITRMTSDINQLQQGVNMVLRLFLRSPIIVFGAMIMAFAIDVTSALLFVVTIPLLSIVIFGLMLYTIPLYTKVQEKLDRVLGITRENLKGVRVIRAFHQEDREEERFLASQEELSALQIFAGKISACLNPVTYVILNVALLGLIYVGAIQVEGGVLTQGEVVAILNYMSQILIELVKMANLIVSMTKAMAGARRVEAVFALAVETENVPVIEETPADAFLTFHHVSLTYEGALAEALHDIHFTVKRGETVGIIGGTGCGKTSLVHLIPRFYPVTGGGIFLEGKDIRRIPAEQLRKRVGIVMQKAVLFKGTIRSNLLWGKEEATEEELWQALSLAQAKEIVEGKPGGLDAIVSQNGKNFSGGQRQRLTIARALVRKPDILILDDSASALDYATDAKLRVALSKLQDVTTFIVSQRISAIRHADKIIVLEDGEMVGLGTHEELLDRCQVYREIYESNHVAER